MKIEFLIHLGSDAVAGHWPWHVAVYHKNEYKCGGSIVDENTILTAAHCAYASGGPVLKSYVSVHVGHVRLNETSENTQIHDVQEIIVHPGFINGRIIHDIALIKLSSSITMSKYVQPVCLWTMDSVQDSIVGKNGTIVGFGLNEHDVVSNHLKQASIQVLEPLACIERDRDVFGTHLTRDMICGIGQANVSACNGDSGGGLFFEIRGKWFVRGLVSYTPGRGAYNLCDPIKPTVYTDVAKYLDWIKPYIDQRMIFQASNEFDIDEEEKLQLFNFKTCGIKASIFTARRGEWTLPWLGFVMEQQNDDLKLRCATTLISEWYTVGPAHCFDDVGDKYFIILGDYQSHPTPAGDSYQTQKRHIQNVTIHPQYNRLNHAHDIALIELLTPADTTAPHVKPICMPVMSFLRTNATANLHVMIESWGNVHNIPVQYVDSVVCRAIHENHRLCAERLDSKKYDYCTSFFMPGSPLQEMKFYNATERYFLRGLDVYGLTCAAETPIHYLNAEPYIDWILYNMKYHEAANATGNSTVHQTLESEWYMLKQQPGKEKLHLFNMDTCGISAVLRQAEDHIPWVGGLFQENDKNDRDAWKMGVLISEWYALAPKLSVEKDVVWRYFFLGIHDQNHTEGWHQYVQIKNTIIPPADHPRQMFALIELLEPANLKNPHIKPICLPFMKQIHQLNTTQLVLSRSFFYHDSPVTNQNLTKLDNVSCQERLLFIGLPRLTENITCATGGTQRSSMGSPVQMYLQFGNLQRYFLYGMVVDDKYEAVLHGVHLFNTIQLADLEWILESVQEKDRTNSSTTMSINESTVKFKPSQDQKLLIN